jgi:hypothetical protein
MKTLPLIAAALALTAASPLAFAQTASTVGAGSSSGGSATIGTGGSAAAGGTSASTLGLGGTSTAPDGSTGSTIGGAGSAAVSGGGKATTSNKVNENPNMLKDQAKAKAQDGGTFSKSMTDTKIKEGELDSRTKSMSHVPGGPPVKSTTTQSVPVK